jgi:hypothetical protein
MTTGVPREVCKRACSLLNCRSLGRFGDLVMTSKYVAAAHSVQNDNAA